MCPSSNRFSEFGIYVVFLDDRYQQLMECHVDCESAVVKVIAQFFPRNANLPPRKNTHSQNAHA